MESLKRKGLRSFFDKRWKIVTLLGIFFVFLIGILSYFTFGIEEQLEEIKSVEIKSDGWDEQEPGAWKITKSAEWTGLNKAQVTFDLETLPKYIEVGIKSYDVVFALDVSTSMEGEKFDALKESLKKYLEEVLEGSDNRISFIEYHTYGTVLSKFTNDINTLTQVIDNLELKCDPEIINGVAQPFGKCTNYYAGLSSVEDVVKDYVPEKGRQLTVLFLTDGSANNDLGLIEGKYHDLKDKYPEMAIHGIQYEMGSVINSYLKLATDDQFDAYIDDIYNKFFIATYNDVLARYEKFDLTDYMSDYFYVNSKDDIKVNNGSIEFDEDTQKILWKVADNTFVTGKNVRMTIDVKVKEPYNGENGYYPTNKGEDVNYQIIEEEEDFVTSKLSPILKNYYTLVYDVNLPEGCNIASIPQETHFVYEIVTKRNDELLCSGYLFKGWEITDDTSKDLKLVTSDAFEMPEHDVVIRAVWGTFEIAKSVNGEIGSVASLYDIIRNKSVPDNVASAYVESENGIDFKEVSSDTNGKGVYLFSSTKDDEYPVYYYRGDINDNNVLFGAFCWKIFRTSETGGIKLIYNGKPNYSNITGVCNNTGEDSQLDIKSDFKKEHSLDQYSLSESGYMQGDIYRVYDTRTDYNQKGVVPSGIFYGKEVKWNGKAYTLVDTYKSTSDLKSEIPNIGNRYYTCYTSKTQCNIVRYIQFLSSNDYTGENLEYILLSNGETMEDAKEKMLTNKYDSLIKGEIDRWYKANMLEKTKFLEDAIWCNDRSIASGPYSNSDISAVWTLFQPNFRFNNRIPSFICDNIRDSFTVSSEIGNGDLIYPVGLITLDEIMASGIGLTGFLNSNEAYLTLSPSHNGNFASHYYLTSNGILLTTSLNVKMGIRPTVSLNHDIKVISGDGTVSNPYIVG